MTHPRYITKIDDIKEIPEDDAAKLRKVEKRFPFRASEYYLSLIDWNNKNDPIRRIILPDIDELDNWGDLDPSTESDNTVLPGIQHKYGPTALMLVSDVCGGICRFCFRKRIFMDAESETINDLSEDLAYIRSHTEISNVLITGGDPLTLATSRLEPIVQQVREIDHVKIIRIGSKMPAYDPCRITGDPSLLKMIEKYSTKEKRIYIMTQFNHPKELTNEALEAVNLLTKAGAKPTNQTPVLRGVNDDPKVLSELLGRLAAAGIAPYYIFQCRPTIGNYHFSVPIEETYHLLEKAKRTCSGLAKRVKFVMSHKSGKIEILATDDKYTYMKYHQAADHNNIGKFMIFAKNPDAKWLEDYGAPLSESTLNYE
ncbi:KamA family radical SAM protein [Methanogenium organophilum]|uniref:KamA family radical SAM protein n=1 Tax=Methanogenium organophilum TaxID=2199 RepID=A0A9X9T6Y9_METOG|nr:KamA family radical SAM protein [Methanogenium organophilum]WAI00818.1 KamA family radical SAM protein [Methanogenium organophilum]